MKTGVELIAEERTRQVEEEGWTADHDEEEHGPGTLAFAGVGYAKSAVVVLQKLSPDMGEEFREYILEEAEMVPHGWPWDLEFWKPTAGDPVRQLTKAGALIAAEIDRIQTAGTIPAKR